MEMLPINDNAGQSYGYIVYKTEVKQTGKELVITNARDFVVVSLTVFLICFVFFVIVSRCVWLNISGIVFSPCFYVALLISATFGATESKYSVT